MQDTREKNWDLNYIYDMAQQAMEAGDVDQAIKLSVKGLKEAKLQVNTEWTPKFEMLTNNIRTAYSSTEPEVTIIPKEDLTKVKGIGPTQTVSFREVGCTTIESTANLLQIITEQAKQEGFHMVLRGTKEFEGLLTDIDITMVKIIETHNSKNVLLICPVKIDPLQDGLIISEKNSTYQTYSENNLQLDKWVQNLKRIQQVLLKDITQRKQTFHYFQNYFMLEMDVNESISHEVSLYSGPTQFRPYIDPLLISNSNIQFIEKSLPFAYQRSSNIHFIQASQLAKLLRFLEKKYYAIEEYSSEEPVEKVLYEAQDSFKKNIRLYSIPFAGFGILTVVLAVSQLWFLLQTFIGLSYGVLGIYGGIMGYLCYNFRVKQREIAEQSTIPHYKRPVQLDDTSLEIIYQELADELMLQFGYECFGKLSPYKILTKIEQKHAEQYLVEKTEHNYNELFEQEKEENPEIESEYIERFGDFLND